MFDKARVDTWSVLELYCRSTPLFVSAMMMELSGPRQRPLGSLNIAVLVLVVLEEDDDAVSAYPALPVPATVCMANPPLEAVIRLSLWL